VRKPAAKQCGRSPSTAASTAGFWIACSDAADLPIVQCYSQQGIFIWAGCILAPRARRAPLPLVGKEFSRRETIGPAPSSKVESLEAFDRLKSEFAELVQRFKNGFTLERCSWSEAYAEGRISLVMYFNRPAECLGGRKVVAGYEPAREALAALVFKAHSESMGLVGRRKGQAMLVDTIKLGKFPQAKLTSAVRLYLIENERCGGRLFVSFCSAWISILCHPAFCQLAAPFGHRR
jgi:hypothetical protein